MSLFTAAVIVGPLFGLLLAVAPGRWSRPLRVGLLLAVGTLLLALRPTAAGRLPTTSVVDSSVDNGLANFGALLLVAGLTVALFGAASSVLAGKRGRRRDASARR